jgi:hypothetical protein
MRRNAKTRICWTGVMSIAMTPSVFVITIRRTRRRVVGIARPYRKGIPKVMRFDSLAHREMLWDNRVSG